MASTITRFADQEAPGPTDVFIACANCRLRQNLNDKLRLPRWNVMQSGTGAGALEMLRQHGADGGILMFDPSLPDLELSDILDTVEVQYPNLQLMTLDSETGQLKGSNTDFVFNISH
jgi:hypothetical protein